MDIYLNLPLSGLTIAMVAASLNTLPKGSKMSLKSQQRVDFAGIAINNSHSHRAHLGWRRTLLVGLADHCAFGLGLVGLPLFLPFESRLSEPTTPVRLFSNRTSLAGFFCAFLHYTLFSSPLFCQSIFKASRRPRLLDQESTHCPLLPYACHLPLTAEV